MKKHISSRCGAGSDAGFSLVELLVVISIIAMLMSLMLPALSKSREVAQSVLCQSNLRQGGMAMNYYRGDYNEYFAPIRANFTDEGGAHRRPFIFFLRPYLGGYFVRADGRVEGQANTGRVGRHLFYCPSARFYRFGDYQSGNGPLNTDAWLLGPSWDYNIATYNMLSGLGMGPGENSDWLRRKRVIVHPDQTLLWADGAREPRVDHSFRNNVFRHINGTLCNIIYTDLHIESLNRQQMSSKWNNARFHLYDAPNYRYAR